MKKGEQNTKIYGIIEVEWVRKKSDLLKIMYEKASMFLEEKDMELSLKPSSSHTNTKSKVVSCKRMITKNYEDLCKAKFDLNKTFEKIEEMHAKKEGDYVGTGSKKTNWSQTLDKLEVDFDKHFTRLKQQQASLQKSLEAVDNIK